MLNEERMIVREGARYWWLALIAGIAWLVLGWLVLRMNATSIATVGVLHNPAAPRRFGVSVGYAF